MNDLHVIYPFDSSLKFEKKHPGDDRKNTRLKSYHNWLVPR